MIYAGTHRQSQPSTDAESPEVFEVAVGLDMAHLIFLLSVSTVRPACLLSSTPVSEKSAEKAANTVGDGI
jgi:hypothetical protein